MTEDQTNATKKRDAGYVDVLDGLGLVAFIQPEYEHIFQRYDIGEALGTRLQ